MNVKALFFILFFILSTLTEIMAYPYDGFDFTGIRRLLRLEWIQDSTIQGTPLLYGAQKKLHEIKLHLLDRRQDINYAELPPVHPELQKMLDELFPNLHESYSVTLLDITPGNIIRYAKRQEDRQFQPGSVGKLAVVAAIFRELQRLYPASFEKRQELLKCKSVKGGRFAVYDVHTVPFFDPETKKYFKRQVQETDVFTLYEWLDHMLSVSNNGAAAVVWREAMLMRAFGGQYPALTDEQALEYFTSTPRGELANLSIAVVNEPLRELCIEYDEWRLGTMFTKGASSYVPPKGGSTGSPEGMMKFLVALEQGMVVDPPSSLEIKRLMYMTDRRIRYAANKGLNDAAVYFKSGSLYGCRPEPEFSCGKYKGNKMNYMNSVAIIEREDCTTYLVALMTNVLRRNSNIDHNVLAGRIDKVVRGL